MAIKSTIYKVDLQVANIDTHYYAEHSLTIARHSSETEERLMMRILAFALNATDNLKFANGLTNPEEPELCLKDLTGSIQLWIDIGQPEEKSILKACGISNNVIIYSYKLKTRDWWGRASQKLTRVKNLTIYNVDESAVKEMTKMTARSMSILVTIQDGDITVRDDHNEVIVEIEKLN